VWNLKKAVKGRESLKLVGSVNWIQSREVEIEGAKMWSIAGRAHRVIE
jgi:hypothetical protein